MIIPLFQDNSKFHLKSITTALLMILITAGFLHAAPIRIVVLPGYAENGQNVSSEQEIMSHYRRTMRFINNQLVRHGFSVVNPVAKELQENYNDQMNQRTTGSMKSVCVSINQKYETDAAYIIWLNVHARRTRDGFCRATARIEGEGYDSAGNDLGAGLLKEFTTVRRSCIEAVELAEKEIGYIVGKKLTVYQPGG